MYRSFTDSINIQFLFIEGVLWVKLSIVQEWTSQSIRKKKSLPFWSLYVLEYISKYDSDDDGTGDDDNDDDDNDNNDDISEYHISGRNTNEKNRANEKNRKCQRA